MKEIKNDTTIERRMPAASIAVPADTLQFMPSLEKSVTLESCDITIATPGVAMTAWESQGVAYQCLALARATTTDEVGRPELPFFVLHFAVPLDKETGEPAQAEVKVALTDVKAYEEILPYPAQPPAWLEETNAGGYEHERPPFEIDQECYAAENPYPGRVQEHETFQIGNLHLLRVRVFPLQYHPTQRLLELARQLQVSVSFHSKGGLVAPAILGDYANRGEPGPEEWVRSIALNDTVIRVLDSRDLEEPLEPHDMLRMADTSFDMLIVTRPALLEQATRLAQWRQSEGTRVFLASLSEEEYPDCDSIRDYIASLDVLNHLRMVGGYSPRVMSAILIFGDAEIIPPCQGMNVRGREPDPDEGVSIVGTDLHYSRLRGDDVPDVAIGRISVDEPDQAEAVVEKIIRYESRDPEDHPEHMAIYSYFADDLDDRTNLDGTVEFTPGSTTVRGFGTSFLNHVRPEPYVVAYIRITDLTKWYQIKQFVSDTELELEQAFNPRSVSVCGAAEIGYCDGQADWGFLQSAELVRLFMEDRGVTVRFGYTRSLGPQPTHNFDGLPLRDPLPTYGWNATTDELCDNWRSGLDGIILHIDHGAWWGWVDPHLKWQEFYDPNDPNLEEGNEGKMNDPENAFYPIVLSICCSSGHFGNETDLRRWPDDGDPSTPDVRPDETTPADSECFCELVLRQPDGGGLWQWSAGRGAASRAGTASSLMGSSAPSNRTTCTAACYSSCLLTSRFTRLFSGLARPSVGQSSTWSPAPQTRRTRSTI